jgi:hypothetical protein
MDGTNTWSAYTYPRSSGRQSTIPVYSNDGLSRNYSPPGQPATYPEAAYGFQRFRADVGRTDLVGLDRLNPQLQELYIPTHIRQNKPWDDDRDDHKPWKYDKGDDAPNGKGNRSARPVEK